MITDPKNPSTPPASYNKQIDLSNWRQPDEPTENWRRMTAPAKSEETWLSYFQCPTLAPSVPIEIGRLLEVARASMIYSWYFYALATLGADQCLRILDTGIRMRCQQAGITTKTKQGFDTRFSDNIQSLLDFGLIQKSHSEKLHKLRGMRNIGSHPNLQMILDPSQAKGYLTDTVELLNFMFT